MKNWVSRYTPWKSGGVRSRHCSITIRLRAWSIQLLAGIRSWQAQGQATVTTGLWSLCLTTWLGLGGNRSIGYTAGIERRRGNGAIYIAAFTYLAFSCAHYSVFYKESFVVCIIPAVRTGMAFFLHARYQRTGLVASIANGQYCRCTGILACRSIILPLPFAARAHQNSYRHSGYRRAALPAGDQQ